MIEIAPPIGHCLTRFTSLSFTLKTQVFVLKKTMKNQFFFTHWFNNFAFVNFFDYIVDGFTNWYAGKPPFYIIRHIFFIMFNGCR